MLVRVQADAGLSNPAVLQVGTAGVVQGWRVLGHPHNMLQLLLPILQVLWVVGRGCALCVACVRLLGGQREACCAMGRVVVLVFWAARPPSLVGFDETGPSATAVSQRWEFQ